jgi:hypothetical protein
MTDSLSKITKVVEAFKLRGFEYTGKSNDGWFQLHGHLTPKDKEKCRCEVELDPQLFALPRIRLLEIPPCLPLLTPHLNGKGYLCYIAEGTVVLDIFDPVGQSLACLKCAEEVLEKVLKGELVEDLEEEFYAHWAGPYCLVDMQDQRLGQQQTLMVKLGDSFMAVITDDEVRTTRKLKILGFELVDCTILTYRIRTVAKPRPHTKIWPPMTVKDILVWQGLLDPRCRRKIEQRIKEGLLTRSRFALVLVESPLMTYGFAVSYDHKPDHNKKKKISKRLTSIYDLEVMPVSVIRIDDRYMAERNVPGMKTLAGKRIAVVGCGTIGGYLAEMFIKAGAGTAGGQLTLIDSDILYPQNIGRHRLGFPSLLTNKAIGMTKELGRLAPGADIRALPVNIMQAQLGKLDLLVDATGEEALGHWLCEHYLSGVPMLSVWIEGPGIAVRALLRTSTTRACYRCLWEANQKGLFHAVIGPLRKLMVGHGCEGLYVPFSASVSVQAASLGAEMALNWANGVHSPSLRTKLIDTNFQLATYDCDPPRQQDCPACPS